MLDVNNQRDKTTSVDSGNSVVDQERMDNYNSSVIPDHNQDPKNMSTRSLEYESVMLNTLPSNYCVISNILNTFFY